MSDRPVSSQLQRIEDGLDMLLQSHAALEKQLEAIDVVGDANRFESAERYKEITGLLTREFGALAERLGAIERLLRHKRPKGKAKR